MRIEAARPAVTGQNSIIKIQSPSWAVLVGVGVMAIYLALLPFIERTWRATGDEPHYLLTAHSLVVDRDFDLTNNYDQLDFLEFYFSKDIERQIRTNSTGQQILNHQLGLPVIIAPAYAVAGRWGGLAFQAVLGGLLAAYTFKLAAFVSGDERAALFGTLAVCLTPPLLMYPYLIYPEWTGAFLVTFVLYYAVTTDRPSPIVAGLILLALLALPWLNRRFIPLAITLALFAVWAWRGRVQDPRQKLGPLTWAKFRPDRIGYLSLGAVGLSTVLLLLFTSQLDPPVRIDITAPATTLHLWSRLARSVGWLVDQQRGLFIFAPIYIVGFWALPLLIQRSFKRHDRSWFVIGPFAVSLGVTALAGGYWVPWELGPRFLVVALPALAPLLAVAWRVYGRVWLGGGLAVLLFGLSLVNSGVILNNPELPYKSSLPLYFQERLGIPFTEFLPDLAGYERVAAAAAPAEIDPVSVDAGQEVWFAEAGRSTALVRSDPLTQLPFGHYRLSWPVRVEPDLPPETEIMRISAKTSGGGSVFNRVITAADLPADGSYGLIEHRLLNPNVDRWRTPLVFHAISTGRSQVWGQDILFTPDPWHAWGLPYLSLALLAGGGWLTWSRFRSASALQSASQRRPLMKLPKAAWGLAVIVPAVVLGSLIYQQNLASRTYQADALSHFVGQAVTDPTARDGRAWAVDPAQDPPQKAIYGPFEFYDPGPYHVTFRMKLPEPVDLTQEIARLQVNATANFDELVTQPLRPEHFSRPNLYHDFVLTVDNPRRQALSFEVHYLGLAGLLIDEVTVTRIED